MIIFPDLSNVQVEGVEVAEEIILTLRTTSPTASCPSCGTVSSRIQSRYTRKLRDLPTVGHPILLILHVRRFFCKRSTCAQKIFVERLPDLCRPHAQRTKRLQEALRQLGLKGGGQAGADLGSELGFSGSRDTILRLVHQSEPPAKCEPRVIGLDDWAWKRRLRYGTLICDLERGLPIDLLASPHCGDCLSLVEEASFSKPLCKKEVLVPCCKGHLAIYWKSVENVCGKVASVAMASSYWFAPRPKNSEHQHPFLVFDCSDRLHLPLTLFGKEASVRVSQKTVQIYLYAILPFFTYLDTDIWQIRAGLHWNDSPARIRQAVEDYLIQKLQCKVHPHRDGWKYVLITAGTRSSLRIFLAALKLFYQVMHQHGDYASLNPLIDSMSATIAAVESHLDVSESELAFPRMPDESGVEEPQKRPAHRLSDNYYKLEHEEWAPQIIADPAFPGLILQGGKQLSLKQTRQRDEVVTWLLFETGARVSEITGLMLGDWVALGTHTKAQAFNKGSFGRRTKVLSFHEETVVLLKRYFDQERLHFDPQGHDLAAYLQLAARKRLDLSTIPLFLTLQGTQLTPKAYREHYWNPACKLAGIEADVHQARHWLVTGAVRDIYETAKNEVEIKRRLRGLVEYMKWRSPETLSVYEHYFEQSLDRETRDLFLDRLHTQVQGLLTDREQGKRKHPQPPQHKREETGKEQQAVKERGATMEPDVSFIYGLAGQV